jgi:hypothetical protein
MKIRLIIAVIALALLSGCATSTQKNAGAFLAKVASMNITAADVSQSTTGPFYNHSESISGLHHQPGSFSIENLKAEFGIPLWGVKWSFSASAISGETPQAVAAVATAAVKEPTTK